MRNTTPRKELAAKSMKLAQTIPDETKRNACIAAAFAFASKYLNENERDELMEVLRMTDLAMAFVEEGLQKGLQEGRIEKAFDMAKNAILEGLNVKLISKLTGLDESTIRQLEEELTREAS